MQVGAKLNVKGMHKEVEYMNNIYRRLQRNESIHIDRG